MDHCICSLKRRGTAIRITSSKQRYSSFEQNLILPPNSPYFRLRFRRYETSSLLKYGCDISKTSRTEVPFFEYAISSPSLDWCVAQADNIARKSGICGTLISPSSKTREQPLRIDEFIRESRIRRSDVCRDPSSRCVDKLRPRSCKVALDIGRSVLDKRSLRLTRAALNGPFNSAAKTPWNGYMNTSIQAKVFVVRTEFDPPSKLPVLPIALSKIRHVFIAEIWLRHFKNIKD